MYKTLGDVPEYLKKQIINCNGDFNNYFELGGNAIEAEFNRALDLMRGFPDKWPEGVEYWAQDGDSSESGWWYAFENKPMYIYGCWTGHGASHGGLKGTIIGDCRTTLRKRPVSSVKSSDSVGESGEKLPNGNENVSDGSTASYYELPEGATELQHLISYRNLNAQDGEIFRAIYRKGRASHSDELRDAKKVLFYARAEVERLEALK